VRFAGPGRLRAAFLFCALSGVALGAIQAFGQNVEAGAKKAEVCFACHGPNGNSADAKFPILAGQTARYLYLQVKDFKEGRRTEPTMEPLVKDLSRDDMFDLAAFFAAQRPRLPQFDPDETRAARGKRKAEETLCTMCHLGAYQGQNEIPRLAPQHYAYIVKQLQDFKGRRRTNDAGNMAAVSRTLSESDIEDLGHFLASLR
jgi:cytochrome c553